MTPCDLCRTHNGRHGSASDVDSEEENEEGDYTVYECPGLAPVGLSSYYTLLHHQLILHPVTPLVHITQYYTRHTASIKPSIWSVLHSGHGQEDTRQCQFYTHRVVRITLKTWSVLDAAQVRNTSRSRPSSPYRAYRTRVPGSPRLTAWWRHGAAICRARRAVVRSVCPGYWP